MVAWLRKFIVFVIVAGLQLQNVHAFVMPLCDHDEATATHQHPQDGNATDRHAHDGSAGEGLQDGHASAAGVKAVCDGCSMCQACSAPAMVSMALQFIRDTADAAPRSYLPVVIASLPERHFRPPLALAV